MTATTKKTNDTPAAEELADDPAAAEPTIDDLIKEWEVEPGTFEFTIGKDMRFTAKRVTDGQTYLDLDAEAARKHKTLQSNKLADHLKPYKDTKLPLVREAVFVSRLVVSPKITFVKALYMARKCSGLLHAIAANIMVGGVSGEPDEDDPLEEIEE